MRVLHPLAKALFVMIMAVAAMAQQPQPAVALNRCLKQGPLDSAGVITTGCDTACGRCSKCCQAVTTATYIGVEAGRERDGLWLTASHAVEGAKDVLVNGHPAEYVAGATVVLKEDACGDCPGDIGWVRMRTPGYVPCGPHPARPYFGEICSGAELFYVNIGPCGDKCGTVNKGHTLGCRDKCGCGVNYHGKLFKTDTLPDCWSCGAMAYDHCGRMVGMVVGGGKSCGRCDGDRHTTYLKLLPEMFDSVDIDGSS